MDNHRSTAAPSIALRRTAPPQLRSFMSKIPNRWSNADVCILLFGHMSKADFSTACPSAVQTKDYCIWNNIILSCRWLVILRLVLVSHLINASRQLPISFVLDYTQSSFHFFSWLGTSQFHTLLRLFLYYESKQSTKARKVQPVKMHKIFKSDFFNFEFLRLISMTSHEGAEVGEALVAAGKIKDGDPESWYKAFVEAGDVAEQIGLECQAAGDRAGARRGFLRSSNYLRAAQFMLNEGPIGQDQRVLPMIERAIGNFRRGVKYRDGETFFLDIPYESGITLPGYIFLPEAAKRLPGRKTPVLINSGGGDSTQEEIYFINGAYGPEVGYAVVTFEGPGQGIVLRKDKIPMRPDWEVVIGRVIDALEAFSRSHPEADLDLQHVAITGASMGGYFALRGAADARIRAAICVDSFYDLGEFAGGRMPGPLYKGFMGGWIPDWLFDRFLGLLQALSSQARWEFNHMKWVTAETSEAAIMRSCQAFTLRRPDGSEYLDKVRCPTLITGAAASWYYDPATTTDKLHDTLSAPKTREEGSGRKLIRDKWVATEISLGGLQAKVGAFGYSAQRTFQWLDKVWDINRSPLP